MCVMTATEASEEPRGDRRRVRLTPLRLMALGLLTLQIAWIFAVPPFRGSDEFDHVYKAAAVARGEWIPSPTAATRGTGAWLVVPTDLVWAASTQCTVLPYTRSADCVGQTDGGMTRIASGAGRYHPLYYAIVGTVALPFHGYAALYVMRLTSLLLCWGLFIGAVSATRTWAKGPWPLVAAGVALTPVLVYSSAIVAPNGVEMLAALALWSSLLGILEGARPERLGRMLIIAALSGGVLATTRSLGPLWALLVGLTALWAAWPGLERIKALARDRRVWAFALVVSGVAVQSTYWVARMSALNIGGAPERNYSLGERIHHLLPQVPLWMLQSIAAFPLRNEPTEPIVYACYLILFVATLGLGVTVGSRRIRAAIFAACAVSTLLPFAMSVMTFNAQGDVWQGRYALPYTLGLVVLAGFALDRRSWRPTAHRLMVGGLVLFVIGQAVGPVAVMRNSLAHPLSDATSWVHPPWVLVAFLAAAGAVLLWWGAMARTSRVDPA
jgi:hypothetical protein